MPPTEESQYTIYCKDRFNHLDSKLDKIFATLEGNGAEGLKGRVTRIEGTVSNQEGRWKWIFGIIAAIIVAVVAAHLRS